MLPNPKYKEYEVLWVCYDQSNKAEWRYYAWWFDSEVRAWVKYYKHKNNPDLANLSKPVWVKKEIFQKYYKPIQDWETCNYWMLRNRSAYMDYIKSKHLKF
jgi:hypothetical protein